MVEDNDVRAQALERVASLHQKQMATIRDICYQEFGVNHSDFLDAGESIAKIYGVPLTNSPVYSIL